MVYKEIALSLMFGSLGFFLAFFISRTVNIAFVLLLAWVPFKVLENYGLKPDWPLLHKTFNLLLSLGESLIELLTNLLKLASTWGDDPFRIGWYHWDDFK